MTSEPEILQELQRINVRLDQLTSRKRILGREFLSGLLRSLGYTVGTLIILAISYYFLSKINFNQMFTDYIKQFIPKPVEINVPFSQTLLDQL